MMRLGGIWEQLVSFENLLLAYRKARLGKTQRPDVLMFALDLENELVRLQRQLTEGTYEPGGYRLFQVYERKPRLIAAAPFRDRVVHHAVMNKIEPSLDATFIDDTFACRKGKGVHAAVSRYQSWARKYRYTLKMDVASYFPSIDRLRLKAKLARRIKDRRVLELLGSIIDMGPESPAPGMFFPDDDLLTCVERPCGIPIGNLTSQFFANLYLDDLDHFLKEKLRLPAYLRYVDDLIVLGNNKTQLHAIARTVAEQLELERLRLHPQKVQVLPAAKGVDVLGYRVFPHKRLLRNDNGHRFARRLRRMASAYANEQMDWPDIHPRVRSWIGHACHADTQGLRAAIFSRVGFQRSGSTQHPSRTCR